MPRKRKTPDETPGKTPKRIGPPPQTAEGREQEVIALAIDLAEQQLRDGTASAQVITHYLKLASRKEQLEVEIKAKEKELIEAKTEALRSAKRVEELYTNALEAMRRYSGTTDDDTGKQSFD